MKEGIYGILGVLLLLSGLAAGFGLAYHAVRLGKNQKIRKGYIVFLYASSGILLLSDILYIVFVMRIDL